MPQGRPGASSLQRGAIKNRHIGPSKDYPVYMPLHCVQLFHCICGPLQILQVRSYSNNYGAWPAGRPAGTVPKPLEASKEPAHEAEDRPVCRIRTVRDRAPRPRLLMLRHWQIEAKPAKPCDEGVNVDSKGRGEVPDPSCSSSYSLMRSEFQAVKVLGSKVVVVVGQSRRPWKMINPVSVIRLPRCEGEVVFQEGN